MKKLNKKKIQVYIPFIIIYVVICSIFVLDVVIKFITRRDITLMRPGIIYMALIVAKAMKEVST